eukprot:scaffold226620_cov14-Tisochrysis_lutea.AAC.1
MGLGAGCICWGGLTVCYTRMQPKLGMRLPWWWRVHMLGFSLEVCRHGLRELFCQSARCAGKGGSVHREGAERWGGTGKMKVVVHMLWQLCGKEACREGELEGGRQCTLFRPIEHWADQKALIKQSIHQSPGIAVRVFSIQAHIMRCTCISLCACHSANHKPNSRGSVVTQRACACAVV